MTPSVGIHILKVISILKKKIMALGVLQGMMKNDGDDT